MIFNCAVDGINFLNSRVSTFWVFLNNGLYIMVFLQKFEKCERCDSVFILRDAWIGPQNNVFYVWIICQNFFQKQQQSTGNVITCTTCQCLMPDGTVSSLIEITPRSQIINRKLPPIVKVWNISLWKAKSVLKIITKYCCVRICIFTISVPFTLCLLF